jgi:glutamyl-tRNA reductase
MLILLGTNHQSAPLTIRERVTFGEDQIGDALSSLLSVDGIEEGMILSTCNRVEILVRSSAVAERGVESLRAFLEQQREVSRKDLARYSYHFVEREAVQHLLRVATGLDSMILGEPQILGPVRHAYHQARAHGTTGPVLERLLQHCLGAAKRLRTETGISRYAVSVAYAAVGLATKVFGDLERRKALILGAGKMGELLAKHLVSSGVSELIVASRTYNHAAASAERYGGRPVHWDDGLAQLAGVDIVVSCTGAPRTILYKKEVARALRARRREPLFMIDIAVPRDIDPAVNDLDNVYLFDIDALQGIVDANMQDRRRAAERAQRMVEDEVEVFERWQRSKQVVPVIVALRESLLTMGEGEITRLRRKLGPLDENQLRGIEELTRAVIQKVLHRPIRYLNNSAKRRDVAESVALYRAIFGLSENPAEAKRGPEAGNGQETSPEQNPRPGPQRLIKGGNN